jgi:hypothetical protein
MAFLRECTHLYSVIALICVLWRWLETRLRFHNEHKAESLLNSIKSWVCCSTSNLTTSNHGMTQEVHNMYCDFILIRVTKSFSDIYHWISPILLSTNYWTLSPYIPIGMLHQDWCWVSAKNPYATCFAHSPPHKINMYFIKFRKEQWEEDDTSQHEQR